MAADEEFVMIPSGKLKLLTKAAEYSFRLEAIVKAQLRRTSARGLHVLSVREGRVGSYEHGGTTSPCSRLRYGELKADHGRAIDGQNCGWGGRTRRFSCMTKDGRG